MKQKLFFFAFFPAIAFSLSAQSIASETPNEPGIDYVRLRRVDTLVAGYVSRNWIKQAALLIVRDNKVVEYRGFGQLDGKPFPADALFRIASQTKALASAGLMTLYEEGKFRLDEPIADFIPEFTDPVVLDHFQFADTTYTTRPAKRGITFRDLLTHSSGLDYPAIGSDEMKAIYAKAGISSGLGVVDADLLTSVKKLAKLPLKHDPGTAWTYGLSVDVIGCLVEIISGKNLDAYLAEKIFRPLGMKDTYFNVPTEKGARLADVFTEDAGGQPVSWDGVKTRIDPGYPLVQKHYFSGGAGLTSTAYDYAVFLQMMLNKGRYNGIQVLAPRTVELMTSGQLDFLYNGSDNFGLGFSITSEKSAARNARNAGSFSWGGFFGTTYWADPKAKLICLIMTQQVPNHHNDLADNFEQLVYQALK